MASVPVMKIWFLERYTRPGWDEASAFVIRAVSEEEARELAAGRAGVEGKDCWLDGRKSSCVVLRKVGEPGIIIRDYNPG